MIWTEEKLKVDVLSTSDFTASWFNSIMDFFIFKGNFLLVFLLEDAPMERYKDWGGVFDSNGSFILKEGDNL